MTDIQNKFIQVLRFCISTEAKCPELSVNEWIDIHNLSKKQALAPIIGKMLIQKDAIWPIIKDSSEASLLEDLLMDWSGEIKIVKRRNTEINEHLVKVCQHFEKHGFDTCLLKGQGNSLFYPIPETRIPGDLDIWLCFADFNRINNTQKNQKFKDDINKII